MTCEEHYFENILYTYKRTGDWKKAIDDKLNTDELSTEVIDAIQTCAIYIIGKVFPAALSGNIGSGHHAQRGAKVF